MKKYSYTLSVIATAILMTACQSTEVKQNVDLTSTLDTNNKIVYTSDFDIVNKDSTYPYIIELYKDKSPQFTTTLQNEETLHDTDSFVTDIKNPILYAFKAEKPNGYSVIILPGGGYFGSAMQHEGFDTATYFNKLGFNAFVLKYRTPNKVDQIPLEDVDRAMEIIEEKAVEFNVDPNKVGVMGSSAGGHLAATYSAYAKRENSPAFTILMYPVITFDNDIASKSDSKKNLVGMPKNGSALEIKYSLEKQVTKDTPKTFIVLNADDDTPPLHSIYYMQSLLKNNVNASLHIYPQGGHGFGFRENYKYHDMFLNELKTWLEREVLQQKLDK